ncbi:MAG: glycoside hydrolase family 127 protein, partial [Janthinobacterium lividum]
AARTDDSTLKQACERFWKHLVSAQMYVTGGIGGFASNEGYGADFDLPNQTAYAETCAAIGLVFWASRMVNLDCDSRYADVMERALYNGVLSGVSLDGTRFFYENPLASTGTHHRQAWFGCACCPPNIARLLASLGQYGYSYSETDIAVHLYIQGLVTLAVAGQSVTVSQTTDYPWDGRVALTVSLDEAASFRLRLRLPGWCRDPRISLNGAAVTLEMVQGYAVIEREWQRGDIVTLEMPMPVERVSSSPRISYNRSRVALQRGPIVYCLEAADNGPDLDWISLPSDTAFAAEFEPGLLGGVTVLRGEAQRLSAKGWEGTLYQSGPAVTETVQIKAIPYFAWDNRAAGEMLVWIRE